MITHLKRYVAECVYSEDSIGTFALRPHLQEGPLGITQTYNKYVRARGGVVVKALRYKPTGRGFDSRWCHWNFSVT